MSQLIAGTVVFSSVTGKADGTVSHHGVTHVRGHHVDEADTNADVSNRAHSDISV